MIDDYNYRYNFSYNPLIMALLSSDLLSYIRAKVYNFSISDVHKIQKIIERYEGVDFEQINKTAFYTFEGKIIRLGPEILIDIVYVNKKFHLCTIYDETKHQSDIVAILRPDYWRFVHPSKTNCDLEFMDYKYNAATAFSIVLACDLGYSNMDIWYPLAEEIKKDIKIFK